MSKKTWLGICRATFGGLACVPLGYLLMAVNNLNGDSGSYSLLNWILRVPSGPLGWALFGIVMGLLWHAISSLKT